MQANAKLWGCWRVVKTQKAKFVPWLAWWRWLTGFSTFSQTPPYTNTANLSEHYHEYTTIYTHMLHIHTFNGPFSGTSWVSQYPKGKTNLDFTEARDSEQQWHQLGHMQVCTSLQTDNHASTPPLSFFTGRMPFLLPNQQCQSTEGTNRGIVLKANMQGGQQATPSI